ncbi:MAG TPA: KamA family radical SAM protein [Candidatus Wunengus sp. YC61]|uniref:KamA family radical SAM protein n=1 Tax=Candidatus Wunengus sp. YC61 TaxID=3367698 RepID=UPI0040267300
MPLRANLTNDHGLKNFTTDIKEYLDCKDSIKTGIEDYAKIEANKKRIMNYLNVGDAEWNDHIWQMQNRFCNPEEIAHIFARDDFTVLDNNELDNIKTVSGKFRFAVSPYYLSLIDWENSKCPIKRQSIPSLDELDEKGDLDPMDEKGSSCAGCITRRYPDRLIINVTNMCAMFCRFCQRRRLIGEFDTITSNEKIKEALEYIRCNKEIRDVLITGGDAFMLPDSQIEWILRELRKLKHVEIIRFGTRTPVTLPQRITKELVIMLKKYHPIYVNTHFNHPHEITPESKKVCGLLADAGIPLGNQMVLLKGVNNDVNVVRKLNQKLLTIRVKPYYIFHPKTIKGTRHFWVRIEEGLEIMESLRGRTSGMAIPTYIINGPKGLGKTPILPNYLLYLGKDKAVFRNWQGKSFTIENEE